MPKGKKIRHITPQQDEIIRKCWAHNAYGHHAGKRAAELTGLTPDVARRRAVELGLVFARERFRWTQPELDLVEQNAYLSLETIQRKLTCGVSPPGVKRTRTAIAAQIHQQRFRTNLDGMHHGPLADALGISIDRLHSYRMKKNIFGERLESIRQSCNYVDEIRDTNRLWFYHNEEIVKFLFVSSELNLQKVNQTWLMSTLQPYITILNPETTKLKASREQDQTRIFMLERLLKEAQQEIQDLKAKKTRPFIPSRPLAPGLLSDEAVAAIRSGGTMLKRGRGRPRKYPNSNGAAPSIPSSQAIGPTWMQSDEKCESKNAENEQATLLTSTQSSGSVGDHSAS